MTNKTRFTSFSIPTKRDLRIFQFTPTDVMVIGCDSSGAIGPKPLDRLKVDGYIVGKFAARVALMEVISTGAQPLCVVDNLTVELNPTGLDILRGVQQEAVQAGLDPKLAVTGSAEKNFPSDQTGVGVTVIGVCDRSQLRIGTAEAGDALVVVGLPAVGAEVLPGEEKGSNATILDLQKLLELEFVHEVIPVGSEGIQREIKVLTESTGLKFEANPTCMVSLDKSAGPATALLASLPADKVACLEGLFDKPFSLVGKLI
ncbi:MAG: AIR synthase related protein [Candidatus Bathyarchaeia archaeon]